LRPVRSAGNPRQVWVACSDYHQHGTRLRCISTLVLPLQEGRALHVRLEAARGEGARQYAQRDRHDGDLRARVHSKPWVLPDPRRRLQVHQGHPHARQSVGCGPVAPGALQNAETKRTATAGGSKHLELGATTMVRATQMKLAEQPAMLVEGKATGRRCPSRPCRTCPSATVPEARAHPNVKGQHLNNSRLREH